ncbi:MAG: hypothetical protein V3S25_12010, partial [Nitrospirales bacterium]
MLAVLLTLCILLTPTIAGALEQGKAGDSVPREAIALSDAVLKALQRNLDITISRKTRDIRLTDIIFEQAKFDPTLDLSGRYDRTVVPLNQPVLGLGVPILDQNQSRWGIGLTQKLTSGAEYDLSFNPTRTSVAGQPGFLFNPAYESTLALSISQPLLRDFGSDINKTQIRIAKNNATVEDHVFFDSVLTVI